MQILWLLGPAVVRKLICVYYYGQCIDPTTVMDVAVIVQGLDWPGQEGGGSSLDTNFSIGRQFTTSHSVHEGKMCMTLHSWRYAQQIEGQTEVWQQEKCYVLHHFEVAITKGA